MDTGSHTEGYVTESEARADPPPGQDRFIRRALPATVPGSDEVLDGVALVSIDRREALNALSFDLLDELADTLEALDADVACRAIVLTGAGSRAFAAGADIRELAQQTPVRLAAEDRFASWNRIDAIRTPLIAAVRGFALGGGCELAMACDMIVAAEDAAFGQPEIKLGVMPGAGGTQRLTRAIGKARAMELILTGRMIDAAEAERAGLVARVVPAADLLAEALKAAEAIAAMAPLAVMAAKELVMAADELPLGEGVRLERRLFHLLAATEDKAEGMAAFIEKRPPTWKGR